MLAGRIELLNIYFNKDGLAANLEGFQLSSNCNRVLHYMAHALHDRPQLRIHKSLCRSEGGFVRLYYDSHALHRLVLLARPPVVRGVRTS